MTRAFACVLLAASVVAAWTPRAMAAQTVVAGMRVRIVSPPDFVTPTIVTVLERHGDTLRVAKADATPVNVQERALTRLEVSGGKSRLYGAATGAKWTAAIAAPFALFVSSSDLPNCRGTSRASGCVAASRVLVGIFFAASGAFYGALGGALIGRERWRAPAELGEGTREARVSLLPFSEGALGLTVRF